MNPKAPIGLRFIAAAKIVKALAMCGLAFGFFQLINRDIVEVAMDVVSAIRISPENKYVELLLGKLGLVNPSTLKHLGELSALDAAIQLIEGLGLWFGAAWAEYVVVVSTGIYVPGECVLLFKHFTWLRLSILLLNALILVYVAHTAWNRFLARREARAAGRKAAGG